MRSPQLQYAIEQVYAEFRAVKPRAIEGCPCCTDPKYVCQLLTKPLMDLSSDDLSNYGARSLLTMGDEQDFKYFLPRMLDIATEEDWSPSPEVLLGKLTLAGWTHWPDRRRAAAVAVIDTWYAQGLDAERPDGSEIGALLCGIAKADLILKPYLNELTARVVALQAFIDANSHTIQKRRRLANAFWKDSPVAHAGVLDFVRPLLGRRD